MTTYSFTIKYIPSAENIVADALSRIYDDVSEDPVIELSDEDYKDIIIANLDREPKADEDNVEHMINDNTAWMLIAEVNTQKFKSHKVHKNNLKFFSTKQPL